MATEGGPSDFDRERLRARDASELELLKATVAFEHAAIRPLYLLNGGAIIAALTFVGNVGGSGSASTPVGSAIKLALGMWAAGLVAAFITTTSGYWSQLAFLKEARRRRDAELACIRGDREGAGRQTAKAECFGNRGAAYRRWGYALGALSVGCFIVGVIFAVVALRL